MARGSESDALWGEVGACRYWSQRAHVGGLTGQRMAGDKNLCEVLGRWRAGSRLAGNRFRFPLVGATVGAT